MFFLEKIDNQSSYIKSVDCVQVKATLKLHFSVALLYVHASISRHQERDLLPATYSATKSVLNCDK